MQSGDYHIQPDYIIYEDYLRSKYNPNQYGDRGLHIVSVSGRRISHKILGLLGKPRMKEGNTYSFRPEIKLEDGIRAMQLAGYTETFREDGKHDRFGQPTVTAIYYKKGNLPK